MIRFSKIAAALAVVPVMAFATPALADSPGQLEGGNVYVVKNLTQGGSYSTTINTACNDEVQYSIRLHNIAFGGLTNIKVSANLISGQMTATPDQGADWGTTASVKVNLPANGSLNVEADTTNLYNSSGSVIKTLPNGITTSGVNAGDLNGSTTEFVIFKAKVACPPVTPVVNLACTELGIVSVDRTTFDLTAKSSVQNANVTGYVFTTKDSNGNTVDNHSVSTSALSTTYRYSQSNVGTYTVSAIVNTDKGSTAATAACTKQFTVTAAPTTPAPTKATSLPNTGAGDVVGLFAGASAAGTAAHAIVTRRKRGL
jgi:hypothetical protein